MTRRRLGRFAVLAILLVPAAVLADVVPEPEGFRLGDYRTPTPATLRGATVLMTPEAEALWRRGGAAFIDVMPQPKRPANLPADTLWRSPVRDSIPGALWVPNVGFGEIAPDTDAYFRRSLAAASGGDPTRPVVFLCMRDCWMSWSAARRAMDYGYTAVHWYPDGTDGCREASLPLERVEPVP